MAGGSSQETSHVSNPVKRIRWATQRVTGPNGHRKRHRIIDRLHRRTTSAEKKRDSANASDGGDQYHENADSDQGEDTEGSQRRIFFNIPLPDDAKDEEGRPLTKFSRNKIRTAKYTALSFIPKNLWFQFHNVANMYFLFVIILGVSGLPFHDAGCEHH